MPKRNLNNQTNEIEVDETADETVDEREEFDEEFEELVEIMKQNMDDIPSENDESCDQEDERKKPRPIKYRFVDDELDYSKTAYDDGYDFSNLKDWARKRTKYLYVSENALSDYALAKERILSSDNRRGYKYDWGVPTDGRFIGFIDDCKQSSSSSGKYILQIILSDSDIRSFTFSQSSFDPVCAAIQAAKKVGGNIFRPADYSRLIGSLVIFDVKNTISSTGTSFSNIVNIRFLDEDDEAILDDMVNIMCEQAAKRT